MEWSPQQATALDHVGAWLKQGRSRPQIFRLFGHAGTGKTTLALHLAELAGGSTRFASFTGKAALVLQKKGCYGASTIHSLIYKPVEMPDGKVRFQLNQESIIRSCALVVIDEVSMVSEDLASDLLSFGKPVLVLGDPGQLPPVRGTGYFIDAQPDILLTEIHRQAADNPIIRLSMDVRAGKTLTAGSYGDSQIIRRMDLDSEMVLGADQILVGTNRTRRAFNFRLRQLGERTGDFPNLDERLICLKNDRDRGLLNGGMWSVEQVSVQDRYVRMKIRNLDDPSRVDLLDADVRREFFTGEEEKLDIWDKRRSDQFDYGYAITVHKAQGSQYDHVMLFDESGAFREHAIRHLYTGITRAAEKITIVL